MDVEVLIAGAGPTGLVLAIDLLRRGVSCRIVDRLPEPAAGSRGFTLKPHTLGLLDGLGVADRIRAAGSSDGRSRIHIGPRKLCDLAVPPDPDPARNAVGLPEFRTERILRERLAELGGRVEFGAGLVDFKDETGASGDDDGDQAVTATLADGSTCTARFLVGADGGGSTVRGTLGVAFEGRTDEDTRALIMDVPIAGLDRAAGTHLWFLERGMVAARPIPHDDHWQLSMGGGPASRGGDVQRALTEATGRTDIRVGTPRWQSIWRYNVRLAAAYRKGSVFLCGDAAHVHSPFGGHGMNTGIQDAINLGWKLELVLRGYASRALLETYESERRPVGEAILADSDRQKSSLLPPRLLRPLMRFVLPRLLTRNAIRDRATYPKYTGSPLTATSGEVTPSSRVTPSGKVAPTGEVAPSGKLVPSGEVVPSGEIAPALPDAHDGRLFTALTFGPSVPELGPLTDFTQVIRSDDLALAYAAAPGAVVLIRPDGYLALTTNDPAAIESYATVLCGPGRP
ncbi:FAD-dependent monooxygenase [Actinoplanes sp. NPDC051851]|uniref:FAD-dependent monooxygenase n=1 Tax=Actinoplanes sp. NPDC051851 TaxID=3154753 RepID=UPI00341B257F